MTANHPLISVLMPAYNHEKYVETAVRSVLGQDWPRIELIVIDDGSGDGTWDVLQRLRPECERRLERVVMTRQENQGTCASMNRLVSMATGAFVGFLASDDMYLHDALSALAEPLRVDGGVGVTLGLNELIDGSGRRCYWNSEGRIVCDEREAAHRTFNEFLYALRKMAADGSECGDYDRLIEANHVANGALIRKSALDSVLPFPESQLLEDWWLHLQLSKRTRYLEIRVPTFAYRLHGSNTCGRIERMRLMTARTLQWEERFLFCTRNSIDHQTAYLRKRCDLRWRIGGKLLGMWKYKSEFARIFCFRFASRYVFCRRERKSL